MTVSARMKCNEIKINEYGHTVKLNAVYSSDKESPNYSFSQATPNAEFTLLITNPGAYEQFKVGVTYDIAISEYTGA